MLAHVRIGLALACASYVQAQGFGGYNGGGGGGNYGPGSNGGNGGGSNGPSGGPGSSSFDSFFSKYTILITAHAVLATLAFGLLFPVGGIIIRLASWPGLWWIHGLFQTFAYILYIAAFAIGVYMASHMHMLTQSHAILGIVIFVLLFFQPFLGFVHHVMFKKHSRRLVWSYGHIWLGRILITLGIINGGLGLQLAKRTRLFAPHNSTIIAYSVLTAIIWLVYVASAVYGEVKRRRGNSAKGDIMPPPNHDGYQGVDHENKQPQYA